MKIFISGTSLLSSYGGPAYSVTSLAAALAAAGHDVGLWAADGSTKAIDSAVHPNLEILDHTVHEALDQFGRPDVIHDNGLWLRHNHQFALLAKSRGIGRIVSARGMLEPWAMNHKRLKKRVAWRAYQQRDLRSAAGLHATSSKEAVNLRRMELGVPVEMIPNGVDIPVVMRNVRGLTPAGTETRMTAVFLGRIYPVKGLPMLIEAWNRVRPPGWRLEIAGPDEAGHRAHIATLVSSAGLDDVISLRGPVDNDAKHKLLGEADLLILPSHSESFGMVVAEALAHDVPVLTTNATPWTDLEKDGCGWCVEPSVAGVEAGLRRATALDRSKLRLMGETGRAFVSARFSWPRVATEFISFYERVAGKAGVA